MSDDIQVRPEPRWRRLLFAIAIVLFLASTAWNVGTRITTQTQTTSSIDSTIVAIEKTCLANRALAIQYRVRGEDEVILARTVLLTTTAFINAIVESDPPPESTAKEEALRTTFLRHYEATIPKLHHILATIEVLPLIDCGRQGEELRQELPPG